MNGETRESGSIVLNDIPFEISEEKVFEALKMTKRNPSVEKTVRDLVEEVRPVAKPKAVYRASYIEKRGEDTLVVEGVEFRSKVLRVNTDTAGRLFPYVVTAGEELDLLVASKDDYMRIFCLDAIKEMILEQAIGSFETHVEKEYALAATAHMNPGSLHDWPISEQPKLFGVLGNVKQLIGVSLTESFLMKPLKSVSGIFFPTEVSFQSCMLCPRHSCSKRRAEYSKAAASRFD